jgi:hypothetical protein
MKTFVPIPVTVTSPRAIRQPRAVQYRMASKRSLLTRFQHFIETTDWEERYLYDKVIDKICLGVVIMSLIYFAPILVSICVK